MRFFRRGIAFAALALAAVPATTGAGLAQSCFICDDLIVLNDADAECFLKAYDASRREAQQKGFVTINLSACTNADEQEKRGSIDKPLGELSPQSGETARSATRSSYVLDLVGIDCLYRMVGGQTRPINPTASFDLQNSCSAR